MAMTEAQLKKQLQAGLARVYVLYGEESYLVEQYARAIIKRAVGEEADAFHLHRFDGQAVTPERLAEAAETLPMMADHICVSVRDMDLATHEDALVSLINDLPETCVLVLWQMTVAPDRRRGWNAVFAAAEKNGCVVNFARKTPGDVVKLLVSGAKRRGCSLAAEDARLLLEQAGNDLNLLLCELDKLAALADGGVITRTLIQRAGTKNLEARVYDLSKAMLAGRTTDTFALLHQLLEQREEPVIILAALSGAIADIYRARVAVNAGVPTDSLAADLKSYKGKEFRLRNAARDAGRLSAETLRDCLDILAQADSAMKSGRADNRLLLEQTLAQLLDKIQRKG